MTTPDNAKESKGEATTVSTEGRRIIGQAIMDGILTPGVAFLDEQNAVLNYGQAGGNYVQRGGGNYAQTGGGNYDQAPLTQEM